MTELNLNDSIRFLKELKETNERKKLTEVEIQLIDIIIKNWDDKQNEQM